MLRSERDANEALQRAPVIYRRALPTRRPSLLVRILRALLK